MKPWLQEIAVRKSILDEEDVVIDDYAGGNVDDAFWKGFAAGQIQLAREIIEEDLT